MENKSEELHEFFKMTMGRSDAKSLTDEALGIAKRTENKERGRQRDADHIGAALKKINLALQELDRTKGAEGDHLLNELQAVKDQVATPTEKRETERVYYNFRTIHDKPEAHSVTTERKKTTGDQAEYLFKLWAFWISEFGEKPSKYREHPFFTMAGILLEFDAGSAHRQWLRNVKEVTK